MISVIVPIYKVEPYLRRCVNSILNQTYQALELILVNDGSPDNCGAICDEYAKQDGRVRVIHKANGGVSSARNAGLSVARGEYISFVDGDDWLHPQMLDVAMCTMEEYCADAVTVGNAWVSTDDVCVTPMVYSDISKSRYTGEEIGKQIYRFVYAPELKDCITCGLYGIYKAEAFKEIRFDETLASAEDVDVIFRLNMGVNSVVHLHAYPYFYYTGNESATRSKLNRNQLTMLRAMLKIGNELDQKHHDDAQKMYYRYLYCFFDYDTKIEQQECQHLKPIWESYRNQFKDEKRILCRNQYLSLLEKVMVHMYLWGWPWYRVLFGKCERHMLDVLNSFLC